jgi:iron(II)-dependent oxidoreductase
LPVVLEENYPPPRKEKRKIESKTFYQGMNDTFVWDNEMPKHLISVDSFVIDNLPVTWDEMLPFLDENPEVSQKLTNLNDSMQIRVTLSTWIDLPRGKYLPAWVNLEIAQLFVKWKNGKGVKCRLMTENEFDSLATDVISIKKGNVNFRHSHAVQVGYYNDYSKEGVGELFSNGWELTETPFRPFEGFQPQNNYEEYSQDFFTNFHFVLKGASPFTHADIIRKSFRNFYQLNYPYHIAKFRLVYI